MLKPTHRQAYQALGSRFFGGVRSDPNFKLEPGGVASSCILESEFGVGNCLSWNEFAREAPMNLNLLPSGRG